MKILTNIDTLEKNGWTVDPDSDNEDPIYRKSLDKGIYLTVWKQDCWDEHCRMWEAFFSISMEANNTPDVYIRIGQEFKAIEVKEVTDSVKEENA